MTERAPGRAETGAVLIFSAALLAVALHTSWRLGAMLNYGDAVAHLHIARRVIDARFPGPSELGSVWLPLPHLLQIPFVAVDRWWASGVAGAIPSALAYLAACLGLHRLARRWLPPAPAALALALFATNPNLLYLSTTAMTEPLFLAELVWTVVFLVEWHEAPAERSSRLLWRVVLVLVAAVFTRYDGWIVTLLAWVAVGIVHLRRGRLGSPAFWLASAVVVAAPAAWLAYNAVVFGDWLDFARGPYSALAIEQRTAPHRDGSLHPGWHDPRVSLIFFVKAAEMNAARRAWGSALLLGALAGTVGGGLLARRRGFAWALLLWLPVPFYAWSIAYGSVPIFLPMWWPHSWYNTRYGLELLPAFALGLGLAIHLLLRAIAALRPGWVRYATLLLAAVIGWNAWEVLREAPLTYVEGRKNVEARRPFDERIPPVLRAVLLTRPGGSVLMNTSVYPEIVALAGIPLRRTINESDREIYQAALAAPAASAAVVLAFDGDEIDRAVRARPEGLRMVERFEAGRQPAGTLYVSTLPLSSGGVSSSTVSSGTASAGGPR